MPLTAYNVAGAVQKLDLSEELAEIIRTDNFAFLQRVGAGGFTTNQIKHSWPEDALNANTMTVNNGVDIAAGDSSFVVTAGHENRVKVGSLIKWNERNKTEIALVTGINTTNHTISITRGYGSTTGEAHADGSTVMIIAHIKTEGWNPAQEDWSQERTGPFNYLSLMGYGIAITRRRQAISHAGVPSEFA